MLNISHNCLGKSLRLGFINQLIELFSFVNYAKINNIKKINLDSINWVLAWNNKNIINHDKIFNVKYWNDNCEKFNFPKLEKKQENSKLINVILPWNHKEFLDEKNKNSEILSYLLKPSKKILNIIETNKPKDFYSTIHFRIEKDLKVVNGWYENNRITIAKTYQNIKNNINLLKKPVILYGCLCLKDVIDKNDLEIISKKGTPWENTFLQIGGSKICEENKIPLNQYNLIGAIIDYFMAIDSPGFFMGHFNLSTFSRSIIVIRKRLNKENYILTQNMINKI